ncbi:hypothetical protein K440DRAFT_35051 [Wilcoxina mikolae CBS 423.85]|nr:hypothetical protein K440DRAFT_35051 [Wilcoxina mikolae CBS 423.85]
MRGWLIEVVAARTSDGRELVGTAAAPNRSYATSLPCKSKSHESRVDTGIREIRMTLRGVFFFLWFLRCSCDAYVFFLLLFSAYLLHICCISRHLSELSHLSGPNNFATLCMHLCPTCCKPPTLFAVHITTTTTAAVAASTRDPADPCPWPPGPLAPCPLSSSPLPHCFHS